MRPLALAVAGALLFVAGCTSEPKVDWGDKYSPTVKKRLDKLTADKDCTSLLAELDTAHAISGAKTGGSGDLVAYILYSLKQADCDVPKS